jgi:hypothetical protein
VVGHDPYQSISALSPAHQPQGPELQHRGLRRVKHTEGAGAIPVNCKKCGYWVSLATDDAEHVSSVPPAGAVDMRKTDSGYDAQSS